MTSKVESSYFDRPIRPEIVRDAPLLTLFLSGDAERLRRRIPGGLTLHAGTRLILNTWFLPNPDQMTGFGAPGPMGVTYLAAETGGEEGATSDGSLHFPGRVWLEHRSSSAASRRYALEASGLKIREGETSSRLEGDFLRASLHVDDRPVVAVSARIGLGKQATASGHSIYYAERDAAGGGRELARYEVPWISDAYSAQDAVVDFTFPDEDPALSFVSNGPQVVEAVSFRRITLVPYLAYNTVRAI